jgi:drug/metabolite transporter superfamily protein YnfA
MKEHEFMLNHKFTAGRYPAYSIVVFLALQGVIRKLIAAAQLRKFAPYAFIQTCLSLTYAKFVRRCKPERH